MKFEILVYPNTATKDPENFKPSTVSSGCQVQHHDGRVCGQPYENHRCFPNG